MLTHIVKHTLQMPWKDPDY